MAVAACVDMNAADRRAGEIGRHDTGGSSVEGERRRQHPAVAQRHQIRLPGRIGSAQNADRVCPVRPCAPFAMCCARHGPAQPFAMRRAVRGCDHRKMLRRRRIGGGQCTHPVGPHSKVGDERSDSRARPVCNPRGPAVFLASQTDSVQGKRARGHYYSGSR